MRAISGSLASAELLSDFADNSEPPGRIRTILLHAQQRIGPASAARQVFDAQLQPLLDEAGLRTTILRSDPTVLIASVANGLGTPVGVVAASGWGGDLRRLRLITAREAANGGRWWIGGNGIILRVVDAARAYARRSLDFDLKRLEDDDGAARLLRRLLRPDDRGLPALTALVEQTAAHRVAVGRSLQAGVDEALHRLVDGFSGGRRRTGADAAFADALTVVYRILFLLFAEARGLVPQWHPVYRESYTIESLRPAIEARGSPAGLWQALQAIARLAHRGCTAGSLRVVPFNGRLFAPSAAPLADSFRLDDRVAREVLRAVTTRPGKDRRERIAYGDLGVEQLGAVYERVLDYTPGAARRKPSGTFYTPRAMTEYLVRRTLAPLVRGREPEAILRLRVVDPAMGSGAFLVAACRYLADAYEDALIAERTVTRGDLTVADRAAFRRVIAQRCLYGVDVNPTAVQLARLSLWLCTLAADRPLTFLDHHLRTGNSLVGATIADMTRQAPRAGRARRTASLPLFADEELGRSMAATVLARVSLAEVPDDTAVIVRGKERTIEQLAGPAGPLASWRACADAWCAGWFWPPDVGPIPASAWPAFAAAMRDRRSDIPPAIERGWRDAVAGASDAQRFFHWELEFPEIFFDADGLPLPHGGFDAVVGNPPWADASGVAGFSRESGCYRLQGGGHANLYQIFAERMLRLTAAGGRVGMLMPSGFLADHGCAELRRHVFERWTVDAVLGFDNREALFPIHRALKFTLLTATATGATDHIESRVGLTSAASLEDIPDIGPVPEAVRLPMTLIRRFGGPTVAVPELETERDRAILARVLDAAPPLGGDDGWGARFGRELNATDDRRHFGAHGLPVIEGKHLEPFGVRLDAASAFIEPAAATRVLGTRVRFDRARLGYREVASSTNRLTLIAAVIPARVVTTHTIFCLRSPDDEDLHWYLCGIFNSFAANYLARLRGGTHLPAAAIHRLPVPRPPRQSDAFRRVAALARIAGGDQRARAEIHARAAALYCLHADDFAHVLSTFPLVGADERAAALDRFARMDAV